MVELEIISLMTNNELLKPFFHFLSIYSALVEQSNFFTTSVFDIYKPCMIINNTIPINIQFSVESLHVCVRKKATFAQHC